MASSGGVGELLNGMLWGAAITTMIGAVTCFIFKPVLKQL